MDISQVNGQNQIQQSPHTVKTLSEGNQVGVRIISSLGKNTYSAWISGVKTTITAGNKLEPGTFFAGLVKIKGGQIQIVPQKDVTSKNTLNIISQEFSGGEIFSNVENPEVISLLQSFNLPENNLSLAIFNQMKQLKLQMDSTLMNKIYKIAVKFKGKEKKAAELLVLMNQKGLEINEENIQLFMDGLEEDYGENPEKNLKKGTGLHSENSINEIAMLRKMIREFVDLISESRGTGLESNDDLGTGLQKLQNKPGILTVMNHLGWKKNGSAKGSWLYLPYEIVKNNEEKELAGKGNLRIFINERKKMEFMFLSCNYEKEDFEFRINPDKSSLKIDMWCSEKKKNSEELIEKLKKCLLTKKYQNENLQINWADKEKFSDFGSGFEKIDFIGGEI